MNMASGLKYNKCEGKFYSDHRPLMLSFWLKIKNFNSQEFAKAFFQSMNNPA